MPTAYTLTPRSKNFSTTATLIHRLRHPLRIQHNQYDSFHPLSPSARTDFDRRRPRVEDDWVEAPTCDGSPYRLTEVEDKGEYSEQRYGDVSMYWNSAMVGVKEKKESKSEVMEAGCKNEKKSAKAFEDSEHLRNAFLDRQRTRASEKKTSSTPVGKQPTFLSNGLPTQPRFVEVVNDQQKQPKHLDQLTNGDRYITLTENSSVIELLPHQPTNTHLTWKSALTRILASPHVDSDVSTTIRTRACGGSIRETKDSEDVDMRDVKLVPNFSYSIASARWYERHNVDDPLPTNIDAHEEQRMAGHEVMVNGDKDSDQTSSPTRCPSASSNSLYCCPTPPPRRTLDPGSILRDILDPDELQMYQQIATHDPRFTALLDDANL